MSYKRLGDFIQQVNVRNTALQVNTLLGVSISKKLIPSIANTIGTDMSSYKIIKKGQFAYGTVTSRNGEKISIALLDEYKQAIVSQIYIVFEVVDTQKLLPEYLMMWFSRPEFDRYARFHSHGSTRETFDWEDMCDVSLPIPSIEKQREIVAQYQSIVAKIKTNEALCEKLEATAQTLYKHWFVDFEFPNENGKPYFSYGGEMVYHEELRKEIPKGWEVGKLGDFTKIKNGYAFKSDWWIDKGLPVIKIGTIQNKIIQSDELGFISNEHKLKNVAVGRVGDFVIAMTGATVGKIGIIIGEYEKYYINQRVGLFDTNKDFYKTFLYFSLNQDWFVYEIQNVGGDSAQANVSDKQILDIDIIKPTDEIIKEFSIYTFSIFQLILTLKTQIQTLKKLQSLLLVKMGESL